MHACGQACSSCVGVSGHTCRCAPHPCSQIGTHTGMHACTLPANGVGRHAGAGYHGSRGLAINSGWFADMQRGLGKSRLREIDNTCGEIETTGKRDYRNPQTWWYRGLAPSTGGSYQIACMYASPRATTPQTPSLLVTLRQDQQLLFPVSRGEERSRSHCSGPISQKSWKGTPQTPQKRNFSAKNACPQGSKHRMHAVATQEEQGVQRRV